VLVAVATVAALPAALAAGTLEVIPEAAYSGALGLRASLGPACSAEPSLTLEPPLTELSGAFEACDSIVAEGVAVVAPGATLRAGASVALGNGFSVAAGADLAVELTGELAGRFAFVTDELPQEERLYRARWAVDLGGLALTAGERVDLLVGEDAAAVGSFSVAALRSPALPEDRLLLSARLSDGSTVETPFGEQQLLPSGWNELEVAWQAASGQGLFFASLNGGPFVGLTGLDNDGVSLRRIHFGLVDGDAETATGGVDLDDFESWGAIGGATLAGCPMFPFDNIWSSPVDQLPVHASSATWVETIGASTGVHPDFGSGEWPPGSGAPIGIPWIDVPGSQTGLSVSFDYDDESDPGPYPIPADPPIEGGGASDGDRHILVVDRDACVLYELFYAHPQEDGSWTAGSGAIFDLLSHGLRPDGWTSADAAGLPILPGLVRYEEVASGEIRHALRFTVPQTRRAYVWPGRHYASSLTGSQYPPMGQRFRLRGDFSLDGYSTEIRVILQALKTYGMMLADNGSAWYLSGAPDENWDNDVLHELGNVTGSDFEAVDVSSLTTDPDSGRADVELLADDFEGGDLGAWDEMAP
jgi:hypothetical protein